MEKFENLGIIGEGSYGVVLKCKNKQTGCLVAVKKFVETDDDMIVKKIANREVRMLRRLRHENLISLLDVFRRRRRLYLVFEFMDHTVLNELDNNPKGLDEEHARRILFQVIRGTEFCHLHNIIHRDIKPENVLISKNGVVKLCDFGFARTLAAPGEVHTDYVSTRWYRAPELLVGDVNYGRAVDIWAIGCLAAEMLTGIPLFPGDSDIDQLYRIVQCLGNLTDKYQNIFQKNPLFSGMRIPVSKQINPLELRVPHVSDLTLSFVKSCLQLDACCRPTASTLLNGEYFTHDNFSMEFMKELEQMIHRDNHSNRLLRLSSRKEQFMCTTPTIEVSNKIKQRVLTNIKLTPTRQNIPSVKIQDQSTSPASQSFVVDSSVHGVNRLSPVVLSTHKDMSFVGSSAFASGKKPSETFESFAVLPSVPPQRSNFRGTSVSVLGSRVPTETLAIPSSPRLSIHNCETLDYETVKPVSLNIRTEFRDALHTDRPGNNPSYDVPEHAKRASFHPVNENCFPVIHNTVNRSVASCDHQPETSCDPRLKLFSKSLTEHCSINGEQLATCPTKYPPTEAIHVPPLQLSTKQLQKTVMSTPHCSQSIITSCSFGGEYCRKPDFKRSVETQRYQNGQTDRFNRYAPLNLTNIRRRDGYNHLPATRTEDGKTHPMIGFNQKPTPQLATSGLCTNRYVSRHITGTHLASSHPDSMFRHEPPSSKLYFPFPGTVGAATSRRIEAFNPIQTARQTYVSPNTRNKCELSEANSATSNGSYYSGI